jgi:thiamine-phosphate pyrophosphorylase
MKAEMRNKLAGDLLLYAVTDRYWLKGRPLSEAVRESLEGGVTFLQLREKDLDDRHFYEEAVILQDMAREYGVPFVVNDNVDIALRMGADGVHVGQSDMEAGDVRALIGPDKILGVSAQTVEQAVLAEKRGADYLGVGAVFPTGSKDDAEEVSYETLKAICEAVSIPVVAIGGITLENIPELAGSGICGIAVISAIFAKADIKEAAVDLKKAVYDMVDPAQRKTAVEKPLP